ncbi:MAG TPA: Hpt domain-containing protein [Verrucomicrobiae bacterium]|nr:Hpt domain-containing protein [Verrucomicrobiae bacterium]
MSENEIVQEFLAESYENLDRLDRELVGLEKDPKDRNALASVFRTIHTIKGTCGFLGFNKLEKVAHVGENLLTLLREGQLVLNPEITTALLSMVDAIRQMLAEIQSTGKDGEENYLELMDTLTRLHKAGAKEKAGTGSPKAEATPVAEASSPARADESSPAKTKLPNLPNPKQIEALSDSEGASKEKSKGNDSARRRPLSGKIGGVLVERGLVQAEKIALALEEQEKGDQRKIGEILVSLGFVKLEDIALAQQILETRAKESAP